MNISNLSLDQRLALHDQLKYSHLNQTEFVEDSGPVIQYKSRNKMPRGSGNNTTSGNILGKKGTTARKVKNRGSALGAFANPTKSWNNKSMFLK